MGRIGWIAVALVLLTAAPAAQAGRLSSIINAVEDAKTAANAVKIENKARGIEATGASAEANVVKIETTGGGGGAGGDGDPPVWFFVLCAVGAGGWILWKIRAR